MATSKPPTMQTQFEFTLPKGYLDAEGNIHREGTMRLATAADEIGPLRDARVKSNPAYLTIVILARVITRLGTITELNTNIIDGLFTTDLTYLQDFYRKINNDGTTHISVTCPNCQHTFEVEGLEPGGA